MQDHTSGSALRMQRHGGTGSCLQVPSACSSAAWPRTCCGSASQRGAADARHLPKDTSKTVVAAEARRAPRTSVPRARARFGSELRSICVSEAEAWTHARAGSPLHTILALGALKRASECQVNCVWGTVLRIGAWGWGGGWGVRPTTVPYRVWNQSGFPDHFHRPLDHTSTKRIKKGPNTSLIPVNGKH